MTAEALVCRQFLGIIQARCPVNLRLGQTIFQVARSGAHIQQRQHEATRRGAQQAGLHLGPAARAMR